MTLIIVDNNNDYFYVYDDHVNNEVALTANNLTHLQLKHCQNKY